jgi:hypothetical protein
LEDVVLVHSAQKGGLLNSPKVAKFRAKAAAVKLVLRRSGWCGKGVLWQPTRENYRPAPAGKDEAAVRFEYTPTTVCVSGGEAPSKAHDAPRAVAVVSRRTKRPLTPSLSCSK